MRFTSFLMFIKRSSQECSWDFWGIFLKAFFIETFEACSMDSTPAGKWVFQSSGGFLFKNFLSAGLRSKMLAQVATLDDLANDVNPLEGPSDHPERSH